MKKKPKPNFHYFRSQIVSLPLAYAIVLSCSPAAYEIIRDDNSSKKLTPNGETRAFEDNSTNGDPRLPSRTVPVVVDPGSTPPTANIVVVHQNKAVTSVPVGQVVSLRPSADTLDPDDIGRSDCSHPGVVAASYDVVNLPGIDVRREVGCESLDVETKFDRPGTYVVTLEVTDNDGEQASSTMTLVVVPNTEPVTSVPGGFTIVAKPLLVELGEPVSLEGFCELSPPQEITWKVPGVADQRGQTISHSFQRTGPATVVAYCVGRNNVELEASLQIVVINPTAPIPSYPRLPWQPRPGNHPDDHLGSGDPGQRQPNHGRNQLPQGA